MKDWRENDESREQDVPQEPKSENLSPGAISAIQGLGASPASEVRHLTDAEQVEEGVSALQQFDEIKPEVWRELNESERLEAMQQVENYMANIQSREPRQVIDEDLDPKTYGVFDGDAIRINRDLLNSDNVSDNVDTIIHEGRHDYQQIAINQPGFHANEDEVKSWEENYDLYLDAENYGQEAYESQPVEADAWNYAGQIRQGLYG
jgi:hypothetical protein